MNWAALANCVSADSHEKCDENFTIFAESCKPFETEEPADGKNLQYFVDRFHNADLLRHKKWFANALRTYAQQLSAAYIERQSNAD